MANENEKIRMLDFGQTESKNTELTDIYKELESSGLVTSFTVMKLCKDSDFAKAFIEAVPDKEEQKKYLINSSKYQMRAKDFDPKYVLFFRRTLPSKSPKPEERWSDNYMQIRNGLRIEIPEGPHRLHSIIICDSLAHIQSDKGLDHDADDTFTDGEVKVHYQEYDQETCLCKFKPAHEKLLLDEYLQHEDALSEDEVLEKIRDRFGKKIKDNVPPIIIPTDPNDDYGGGVW